MSDNVRSPEAGDGQSLIQRPFSRRQVLRGGLVASGAAFLAACGQSAATQAPTAAPATAAPATAAPATAAPATAAPATAAPATAAPATPSVETADYSGVTLNNFTGGYMIPWLTEGTRVWNEQTGGTTVSDNVTFAEKQIKQAGIIATQDSSWDMMYMTEAYGYVFKFGARLIEPVEDSWFPDGAGVYSPTAIRSLTSPDGVWRALPLYEFPSVWTWNKRLFEAVGEDPENPPDNYPALIALVPKFKEKGIIPSIQPWLATQSNLFALLYFTKIYNSTGEPMFSEDRTQLLFHGEAGLETFRVIEDGIKSGFWDPDYMNITNEGDAHAIFLEGNVACVMHSERPVPTPEQLAFRGVRQHPGVRPGTTGSTGGSDGLGISKFSRQKEACQSWSRVNFGFDVTKAAAATVTDADGNLVRFPVARTDVLALPEVQEAIPLLGAFAAQRKGSTALWPTPYNIDAVFNEALAKMISGEFTAAQAHDFCVKGTQDLIIKYLSA